MLKNYKSSLHMNRHSQDFFILDSLTPQLPDDLLPLLGPKTRAPHSPPHEAPPNLDIILSKFLNNDELNDIELQQLSEQEREVFEQVQKKTSLARKRPDQYQKLFYRRAFKFAEKQFFGTRKNKSRKMSSFYHFYFGSTAQNMNVPLVNFYHPDKKTRPGLRVGQKSFNRSYIRLLLRSQPFREISKSYRENFFQECVLERQTKIGKFSNYLRGVLKKCGSDTRKMQEVIKSSKCKIPWSNREIAEADRRAREDLEHYQLQFSETGGDQESEYSKGVSSCEMQSD